MQLLCLLPTITFLFFLILRSTHAKDGQATSHQLELQPDKQLRRRGLWRQSRIVGGQNARAGSFPAFVELPNGCGGTLIHNDLVITAAHCVHGNSNSAALRSTPTVYVGGVQTQQGEKRTISDFRIDPRYQQHTEAYDFAILLLEKPVDSIVPAQINTEPTYPMDGTPLSVAGYGRTHQAVNKKSTTLQHAVVNYREDCSSASYAAGQIHDFEMMCANAPDFSSDACQGDSGGPLLDANKMLVGVVSWGEGCAQPNKPGVYARISAASDWIEQQKCELSNVPPGHCTCTKFSSDCVDIRVDVRYDSYPSETGWQLTRQGDAEQLVSLPVGSITSSHLETISYPVLVPPGSYEVDITDAYGDGICCNYGSGSVTVFNGVTDTSHSGAFGGKAVIPFEVEGIQSNVSRLDGTPPTGAPTTMPRLTLRVEIVYDWYPKETGWSLVDESTGTTVYSSAAYSVLTPMQPLVTNIPGLLPGGSYTFSITDIANDGLCCSYGKGSARLMILEEDGSEGTTLWSSNGVFGALARTTVSLPSI